MTEPVGDQPNPVATSRPADRNSRRRTGVLAGLVLLGAAAGAGAAAMTWWTADYIDPLTGPLTLTASGADARPELVPVALIALAAFGASLATQGWVRRLIGVVLLAGGLLVAVRAALSIGSAPVALTAGLVRPADPAGPAVVHPSGPLLALAGGLLLVPAGALVTAGIGGRRRLGARYDAPSTGRIEPAATDPGDWWKALDAGTDPTDPTGSKGPPPGGYHDQSKRAR